MIKNIKPFWMFRPKKGIYRRGFDKTKCIYIYIYIYIYMFLIKKEKVFDKSNEIWEKVSNIIKK